MSRSSDESIPTRQSLLRRLKNWDDQTSWRTFFDTYWKLIYGVARKAGLSEPDAEDVVQETMLAVAKKMPGFRYDPAIGSFKSWLMQIARRRIVDRFRRRQLGGGPRDQPREHALGTTIIEQYPDPAALHLESLWDEEWKKHLFEAAAARVKQRADPLQYQVFYLHAIKGIDAKDVAQRLGVKLPEVYFAKYKISALIRKEIRRLEKQML